jgi:hypothetical protein
MRAPVIQRHTVLGFLASIVVALVAHQYEAGADEIVESAKAQDVSPIEDIRVTNVPEEIEVAAESVQLNFRGESIDVDDTYCVGSQLVGLVASDYYAGREWSAPLCRRINRLGQISRCSETIHSIDDWPCLQQFCQPGRGAPVIGKLIFEIGHGTCNRPVVCEAQSKLQDFQSDNGPFQFGKGTFSDAGGSSSGQPQTYSRDDQKEIEKIQSQRVVRESIITSGRIAALFGAACGFIFLWWVKC